MTTRQTPVGQCPDAEVLAAWADGTIYGAEADGLEAHLADCQRCQAILAAFATIDPDAAAIIPDGTGLEPERVSAGPVIPFPRRPSPLRWALLLAAAASLILYMVWPKPPAILQPAATSIARNEPNAAPASAAPAATLSNGPVQTPSIGPAPKLGERADQKSMARTATAPAPAPPPPPPASLRTTAGAPGQVASPSPTVVLSPPPATTTAAGATSEQIRVAPLPIAQNATAALVQTRAAADRSDLSFIMSLPGGGVEFGPTDPIASVTLTPSRQGEAPRNPLKNIRWRVSLSGIVEKTIDSGATWTRMVLDPAVAITTGTAPSNVVCWLAGKAGAVMRSTDGGTTWTRVTAPSASDVVSITATDAQNATVATADGQRLSTADGGQTWHK